jgi:hypothetical protein
LGVRASPPATIALSDDKSLEDTATNDDIDEATLSTATSNDDNVASNHPVTK